LSADAVADGSRKQYMARLTVVAKAEYARLLQISRRQPVEPAAMPCSI
jgi:hypothetical protein